MATFGLYPFDRAEVQELCDLTGIANDLEAVLAFANLRAQRVASKTLSGVEADVLSTAVCIRYARCFVTGVRKHLTAEDVEGLGTEAKATHAHVMTIRSKRVAHSVNAMERLLGVVQIRSDAEGHCVQNVSCMLAYTRPLSDSDWLAMPVLATALRDRVSARIAVLTPRLIDLARGEDLERIVALGVVPIAPIDMQRLDKPRRQ